MRYSDNWYAENGEWMQNLDKRLRERPNSGAVDENVEPDIDYGLEELDDYYRRD